MEKEEIFSKVVDVLVEQLGVEKENVKKDSEIMTDLGADSLDVVDLIMTLEEEFGIEIPDSRVEKMKTVGDVVRYIEENN